MISTEFDAGAEAVRPGGGVAPCMFFIIIGMMKAPARLDMPEST